MAGLSVTARLSHQPLPPCLHGGVADLCHYSKTQWGCECCPHIAYTEGCRAACPCEVEIPHANPQTALGLFSASCLRSAEQRLESTPESLAKSLLLFHL